MTAKLILLSDIYEVRKRKEEELAFYHEQLEKLKSKMFFVITFLCLPKEKLQKKRHHADQPQAFVFPTIHRVFATKLEVRTQRGQACTQAN